jgi:hypothetical protein
VGSADETEDLGPSPGTAISGETPIPDPEGTITTFFLSRGYRSGSLQVAIDGIVIPASEVTETDPGEGQFALSWAPDADELITVSYLVGP